MSVQPFCTRAVPATKLFLVKSGTTEPVGRAYLVTAEVTQTISIPVLTLLEQRNSGPLSQPVNISNMSSDPIALAMLDEKKEPEVIAVIPARTAGASVAAQQVPLAPGLLYLYNATTNEPIGKPYELTAADSALALPIPPSLPLAMRDPTGPELKIINRTGSAVTIARVFEKDGAPLSEAVAELKADEEMTSKIAAGSRLAFFDAANQAPAGSAYVVRTDATQTLYLPYDAGNYAQKKAQNANNFVMFRQPPNNPELSVFLLDENNAEVLKKTVKANSGQFAFFAAPGTQVVIRDAVTSKPYGEMYTVIGAGKPNEETFEQLDIPYQSANLVQLKHRGPGAISLTISNGSDTPMFVAVEDSSGGATISESLANLLPQSSRTVTVLPTSRLWFYDALRNQPVGSHFDVPNGPALALTVPLPVGAATDPDRVKFIGPPAVTSWIINDTTDAVYIVSRNEIGVKSLLYEVPPSQKMLVSINPEVPIWFTKKGTPESFGQDLDEPVGQKIPYIMPANREQITLPYEVSDADFEKMIQIDLEKLKSEALKKVNNSNQTALDSKDLPAACWRNTQVRDIGKIPVRCKSNEQDSGDGLCYDRCRSGYYNAVTMCVPECPAGFDNDGLYCRKPAPYKRDEYPVSATEVATFQWNLTGAMSRCVQDHGSTNCVAANSDTIVYETCRTGYQQAPLITNLCTPVCPGDMEDIGVSCRKTTYDRGIGRLKQCDTNQDTDAGLCYNKCSSGFEGVGPVCWAQCPAKLPTNCGTTCAASTAACGMAVSDQVLSPLLAVGNVVLTVVTVGTATGAQVAAKAGITALKTTGLEVSKQLSKQLAREAAKQAAKATLKNNIKSALQLGGKQAAKTLTKVVAKETAIDLAVSLGLTGFIEGMKAVPWHGIDAARKDIESELQRRIQLRLAREVTDAELEVIVNASMAAAEEANPGVEFPWQALDPSGIADIVIAYNLPMCSDVR